LKNRLFIFLLYSFLLTSLFSSSTINVEASNETRAVSVGVKEGDWWEYAVNYTGDPPNDFIERTRIEVERIQGNNITINWIYSLLNGETSSGTETYDLEMGVNDLFLIEANLEVGDEFYHEQIGQVVVSGTEEYGYAGEERILVWSNLLEGWTSHWDKTTGVLTHTDYVISPTLQVKYVLDKTSLWGSHRTGSDTYAHFQQVGVGPDFIGNILSVDNIFYKVNQLSTSFTFIPSTSHTFSWSSPLTVSNDKRYVWSSSIGFSTDKSGTFSISDGNVSIIADYVTQFYVRFQTPSDGSIENISDWHNSSSQVEISATPSTGYTFNRWATTGSVSVSDSTSQETILSVDGPGEVMPSFNILTFTISASAGSGGYISPSGSEVVYYGDDQSFSIMPSEGYHITDVLVDGSSVGVVESYSFTSVVADHTVIASFELEETSSSGISWEYIFLIVVVIGFIVILLYYRSKNERE
jgi:hypothetical protein